MKPLLEIVKNMLGAKPLYLILLPLFFIYSGYNELFGFLSFSYVIKNLATILMATVVMYAISYLFLGNYKKASVYCFFIILVCLLFGFIHDSLKSIIKSAVLAKYTIILPVIFILFLVLLIAIKKSKKQFKDLFLFLNTLFIILILSEIPNSIKRYQLDKSVHNLIDFRFSAYNSYNPGGTVPDSLKPDIFLLVFDALASSKSMHEQLGYSNFALDSFLKDNNFYVAKNAKANYNSTIFSVSSMLNLDYLPPWIKPVMNEPKILFWGTEALKNNSLYQILNSENYTIHNYEALSSNNPNWIEPSFFDYLRTQHYYSKTLMGRFHRDIFWNFVPTNVSFIEKRQIESINRRNELQKKYLDKTISLVKRACVTTSRPKFVYGHFMVTHDPYLFDSAGQILKNENALQKNNITNASTYCDQMPVANSIISDLVTHIKQKNKQNTIIIVMSDHGFPLELIKKSGYSFDAFNSFYFPDQNYKTLNDSIQPVNNFRIILNKFFGANYPMLKDSTVEVTSGDELKSNKH